MTIEKHLSVSLKDVTAVHFRCESCRSILIQTGNSVAYKCGGCGREWKELPQQEYMLAIGNFLTTLQRLKNRQASDPAVTIALEFEEE